MNAVAPTLNLDAGDVDSGKTTSPSGLYDDGVIDAIAAFDAGKTQTDAMALERRPGSHNKGPPWCRRVAGVTSNDSTPAASTSSPRWSGC